MGSRGNGEGGNPLTVLTVYHREEPFTDEYVTRLAEGVSKHLTVPHQFVCMTRTPVEGITCLEPEHSFEKHWAKAEIFRPDLPFDRVLFLDLSSVIHRNINEIATQEGVVITKDFNHGTPSQSVLLYNVGDFAKTWEAFIENPDHWISGEANEHSYDYYDQALMNHTPVPEMRYWQDVLPGQVCSFKYDGVNSESRIVKFHGKPKPHELNWLEEVTFKNRLNISGLDMLENAKKNWGKYPAIGEFKAHGKTMNIVAGGPSLEDTLMKLRFSDGDVFALNGTHDYLIERGLVPDYMVLLDARQENTCFFEKPHKDVQYLIAVVCDPEVLEMLEGYNVAFWVNYMTGMEKAIPDAPLYVGGGATVGMKSMFLGYLMGYRKFRLFGMDSCYRGEENHAYKQTLNDGEDRVDAWVGQRHFVCSPWMYKQAKEFIKQTHRLAGLGCVIDVEGDGMLAEIVKGMNAPKKTAAQVRAEAVLQRLPPGPLVGAEIGVFAGDMSEVLLKRDDLTLFMVDSWEAGGGAYVDPTYSKKDWHTDTNQEEENAYMERARKRTFFAGERAKMVQKRSLDAAKDIPDKSLDFVFIDADHSYEGCLLDLKAWYPKLKDGGLLCGHDIGDAEFGVTQAVEEFAKSFDVGADKTYFIKPEGVRNG